jgi:adenylate cyclase
VAYCALTQRCADDGLRAAQSAIDLDRQLGQIDHLAVPLIVLGQIHQCHGEFEKALRYYEEARGLAEEMGEPQLMFPCYEGLATVYLDQGDDARAEQYFIRADEVCAKAGVDRDSLVVLPFLC